MQPSNPRPKNPIIEALPKHPGFGSQLREHWAKYLATFGWRHFATLTFANLISVDRARREFLNGFVRRCAFQARRATPWFYAIERDVVGQCAHLHALIAGTDLLTIARMEESWTAGHSRIRIYDPARRAAWYESKTLGTHAAEYDISKRLPPRVFGTGSQLTGAVWQRTRTLAQHPSSAEL